MLADYGQMSTKSPKYKPLCYEPMIINIIYSFMDEVNLWKDHIVFIVFN